MQTVNVLCIKWGRKYGPEYVNRLHSMVRRHLKRPFRFICLSDDGQGVDADIDVRPIPMVGFEPFDTRQSWSFGHGWLKLTSFADPLSMFIATAPPLDDPTTTCGWCLSNSAWAMRTAS